MLTLKLNSDNESAAAQKTRDVRWSDPRTCNWLCATQVWTFSGDGVEGDAIMVVTGRCPIVQGYAVLRLNDTVHVVACNGLAQALRSFGYKVDSRVN